MANILLESRIKKILKEFRADAQILFQNIEQICQKRENENKRVLWAEPEQFSLTVRSVGFCLYILRRGTETSNSQSAQNDCDELMTVNNHHYYHHHYCVLCSYVTE